MTIKKIYLLIGFLVLNYTLFAQKNFKKEITERGFCAVIEGNESSENLFALHKTYNVGTYLLVKNTANGRSIRVKVIGKLPNTANNQKLILKISKRVYNEIRASGKKISVEIKPTNPPWEDVEKEDDKKEKEDEDNKENEEKNENIYVVKKGDTLFYIAKKFKVSVKNLKKWNKLEDENIQANQKLIVAKK
jgi:LysM repeat protein